MFLTTKKLNFLYVFTNLAFSMNEDPNFFEILDSKLNFFEIIQNFGVTSKDKNNNTQLHLAVYYAHKETIKKLLQNPYLDINAKNTFGNTALHDAIYYGNINVLNILLSHPGININIANNIGQTPLHLAVKFGQNVNILKALLLMKNVDILIKDKQMHTALDLSRIYGKKGHEKLLCQCLIYKSIDDYIKEEFELIERTDYVVTIFTDSSENNSSDTDDSRFLTSNYYEKINLTLILCDIFPYLLIIEDYMH